MQSTHCWDENTPVFVLPKSAPRFASRRENFHGSSFSPIEPNCLPGKPESSMMKMFPSRLPAKGSQFAERKRALSGKTCIISRHLIAKEKCGENRNSDRRQKSASQVGNKDKTGRQLKTPLQ